MVPVGCNASNFNVTAFNIDGITGGTASATTTLLTGNASQVQNGTMTPTSLSLLD